MGVLRKSLMLTLAGMVIAPGCGHTPDPEKTEHEIAAKEAAKPLPKGAVVDPMVLAQRDIALEAHLEGDRLHVSVRNKTKKTIVVGPKNLAVVKPGQSKVEPFEANNTGFPITSLGPDSEQIGIFRLRGALGELKGGRLLFNHPEVQPAYTIIR